MYIDLQRPTKERHVYTQQTCAQEQEASCVETRMFVCVCTNKCVHIHIFTT